jgi:hypothetical protein
MPSIVISPPVIESSALVATGTAVEAATLVAEICALPPIVTAGDAQSAVNLCRRAKRHVSEIEAERLALTRPLDAMKKKIIEVAKGHCTPVLQAISSVEEKIAVFHAEEARRAQLEEQRRAVEAAEIRRAALNLDTLPESEHPDDSEWMLEIAASERAAELHQQADDRLRANVLPAFRPKGASVRPVLDFEVTDINALYAARPDLVRLEPNRQAIREILVEGLNIPGLQVFSHTKATIRA